MEKRKKEAIMKSKKFNRKLMLNKKTVANLNTNEMNGVLGGGGQDDDYLTNSCNPCAFTPGCPESVGCPQVVTETCVSQCRTCSC